jgi:hypothetical protein
VIEISFQNFCTSWKDCQRPALLRSNRFEESKTVVWEIEILLDFHCHPNSKTLFVRIRDSLKRKGVEFSNCKISIQDSSVSEGELVETMKQINDEKLNV